MASEHVPGLRQVRQGISAQAGPPATTAAAQQGGPRQGGAAAAEGSGAGVRPHSGGNGLAQPTATPVHPAMPTPFAASAASAKGAAGSAAGDAAVAGAAAGAASPALGTANGIGTMRHDGRPVSRATAHIAVAYFIFRQQARARPPPPPPASQPSPVPVALLHHAADLRRALSPSLLRCCCPLEATRQPS